MLHFTILVSNRDAACYTLALAEAVGPAGRVIAFEPFRWMHQQLTANVAINGLQNVWPVQVALGRRAEVVQLYPPQFRFFASPGGVRVDGQFPLIPINRLGVSVGETLLVCPQLSAVVSQL